MNTTASKQASVMGQQYQPIAQSVPRGVAPDLAVVALLALVGFLDFSGTFQEWNLSSLGGDMIMIMTRALAGLDPSLYAGDFLFDLPANYTFYNNFSVVYFQLMELLGAPAELGLRILKAITTFAYLLGYYCLGRRVLGLRLAALAFAVSCAVAIPVVSEDYWGMFDEPQPRLLFAAALPYLLLFALAAEARAGLWLLAMFVMGLAFWLHPASGPPVALAVMAGMIARAYPGVPLFRVGGLALVSGLLFLVIIAPNLAQYLLDVYEARVGADPEVTEAVRRLRYSSDFLDTASGAWNALTAIFAGPRFLLAISALVGVVVVLRRGSPRERLDLRLTVAALVVLFFASAVMPIVSHAIARADGQVPTQLDLIRSIRYIVPFLLLLAFWGVVHLSVSQWLRSAAALSVAVTWAATYMFPPSYPQDFGAIRGARCLLHGHLICTARDDTAVDEVLDYIYKETPQRSVFFSPVYGIWIRSIARHSLAFDWKDVGWLAYSNHARLGASRGEMERFLALRAEVGSGGDASAWVEFGRSVGADYVVVRETLHEAGVVDLGEIEFQNDAGTVIRTHSN